MLPLTLTDIREWLEENRAEYEQLRSSEFPPINDTLYWTFKYLSVFIDYYRFKPQCIKALYELKPILNEPFPTLIKWIKTHYELGVNEFFSFERIYFDWVEDIYEEVIKIHEGLYTERKPFNEIICFSKIFYLLHWDFSILKRNLTDEEQDEIREYMHEIFEKYS